MRSPLRFCFAVSRRLGRRACPPVFAIGGRFPFRTRAPSAIVARMVVYLTENDVAVRLTCGRREAMRVMRAAGAVQIASRKWRIAEEALENWMQAQHAAALSRRALSEYAQSELAAHRARLAASLYPPRGTKSESAARPMVHITYPRIKARKSGSPQVQLTPPRRAQRYSGG